MGFADAVLAREVNGELVLIDGHLRAEISPEMSIPVLVVDVNDEEADKILATHDPLAAMAETNKEALSDLLKSVSSSDSDVQKMLEDLAKQNQLISDDDLDDGGIDESQASVFQKKWGTDKGQLWEVQGKQTHRLLCGDATAANDVTLLLAGAVPLLMVTDPPYGVKYDPAWRNEAAKAGKLAYADRRIGQVSNDDRIDWSGAYKLFTGDVAYTWSPGGDPVILTGKAIQDAGFEIRNQIIWKKSHFPISRGHYTYQHEPCWYAVRKGRKSHWIGDMSASTVWDISLDKNIPGGHSTQKPVECMARPIRNHESKSVYDPFIGSGTTMVACEGLGRSCYAMDISPEYCAVVLERMTVLGCKCGIINPAVKS